MFRFFKRASSYRVSAPAVGADFDVPRDTPILEAALASGRPFPHSCRVGTCGTCKCKLVSGKIHELADRAYALSAEELADGFILACQSLPRSDLVLDVPTDAGAARGLPVVNRAGEIAGLRRLTHDILELEFLADEPFAYRAGQYFEFALPSAVAASLPHEVRAYSFASAPTAEPSRTTPFHVRLVPGGIFTNWLHTQAKLGDRLAGRGPFGDLALDDSTAPILAIAGGSGMAPIKALLEQALTDGVSRDVHYYFGARRRGDIYCEGEMARIRERWRGRFEFVPVLSDEPPSSDWRGPRGFVSEHVRNAFGARIAECRVVMCGPPPMIDAASAVVRAVGVASQHIRFDKFFDRSHAQRG